MTRTRDQILAVVAAALGVVLFAYTLRRAGVGEVAAGVSRIGWGFGLVLALSGFRLFMRSLAWICCLPERSALKPGVAFRAILVGEALGNVTPLGLVISEPAKATFVRRTMPISSGLPALAVENIFYSVSVAIVIGAGMLLLLGWFEVPAAMRLGGVAALALVGCVLGVAALVMGGRWRPASAAMRRLLPTSETWIGRVADFEDRIYGFARVHPGKLPAIAGLELMFHVAGVAEAYLVLRWLGAPVTLATAFVLESVNRIVNVVFRFVPLRLGVDEAGSGLLTHVLGFGAPTGVALAIVRKARVLVWSALGLTLLAKRAVGR